MIFSIVSSDLAIDQALYAMRTPLWTQFLSLATDLGGALVVISVMICVLIILWNMRRWQYGVGMIVSVVGGLGIAEIVKYIVARPRPPLYLHAVVEGGYSFPSNHATVAMALYGFLTYATWKCAPYVWRVPLIVLFSAVVLLVGFSRVYLGVHYPSDVIAGYAIGLVFVWIGAKVAKNVS